MLSNLKSESRSQSTTDGETEASDESTADGESTTDEKPTLSVKNLTKTYSDGEVTAVDDVSFDVERGSVVGLLGPNGAGKTTTIKSMLGTLVPDEGTVEIDGRSVHDNLQWAHENLGVMFEGSRDAYWRLTVRENLEFFTRLNGIPASERRERQDELLERLDLTEKADVPVRKLSRGMKQKVALASTLSQDIELAFLDEPTLGLDVETSLMLQQELRSLVADRDLTVMITSHDMEVIQNICDRVIVLSEGSVIADDTVANLLELFQNDAYRFTLEDSVSEETVETIRSRFDVTDYEEYAGVHEFEVALLEGDVHDLSDELRELDCTVRSFEEASPDLGEIFLKITNDDGVVDDA